MPAHILVIEDNPANLELISYLLKAYGFDPAVARDGEEGLEAAARTRPDLVLCDVQLPRIDGLEVVRRLKNEMGLTQVPVVAVTALAMVGDRERLLAAGFDGYIGKPIEPRNFIAQVQSFLGGGHAPLPAARAAAPAATPSPAIVPTRGSVLVVDNAAVNRQLLSSLLTPAGFEVLTAASGNEAACRLQDTVPELIVCDIHMPGGDGFELLQRVKSDPRLRRVPFILISATVWDEVDRRRGLALGADRFILRPVEARTLIDEIEGLLAAKPRAGNEEPATAATSRSQPRARILVVDDSPTSRDLTEMLLQHLDYEVLVAADAGQAFAAASASPCDLILSDLHMPGGGGFELLRQVKAEPRLAAIPVVLLSASSFSAADVQRALALGADRCIERPVELEALQQLIDEVLARPRWQAQQDGEDPDR